MCEDSYVLGHHTTVVLVLPPLISPGYVTTIYLMAEDLYVLVFLELFCGEILQNLAFTLCIGNPLIRKKEFIGLK